MLYKIKKKHFLYTFYSSKFKVHQNYFYYSEFEIALDKKDDEAFVACVPTRFY